MLDDVFYKMCFKRNLMTVKYTCNLLLFFQPILLVYIQMLRVS